jgi:hypothetical protein
VPCPSALLQRAYSDSLGAKAKIDKKQPLLYTKSAIWLQVKFRKKRDCANIAERSAAGKLPEHGKLAEGHSNNMFEASRVHETMPFCSSPLNSVVFSLVIAVSDRV